jgi:hypothetical protein
MPSTVFTASIRPSRTAKSARSSPSFAGHEVHVRRHAGQPLVLVGPECGEDVDRRDLVCRHHVATSRRK